MSNNSSLGMPEKKRDVTSVKGRSDFYNLCALSMTAFIMSAALVIFLTTTSGPDPSSLGIQPYLLELMGTYRSYGPSRAHTFVLCVIGIYSLAAALICTNWLTQLATRLQSQKLLMGTYAVCAALAIAGASNNLEKLGASFVAVLLIACLTKYARGLSKIAYLFCTMIPLCILCVIPALSAPDFAGIYNTKLFVGSQSHYACVFGSMDRLARSQTLFADVFPNYGLLAPILLGTACKGRALLSMGDCIGLVRASNILFLMAAAWLYLKFGRSHLIAAAIAFCVLVPFFLVGTPEELTVTTTAWRTGGFAIFAMTLMLLVQKPWKTPIAAGICATICLLANIETGMAIACGLISYLFFKRSNFKEFTVDLILFTLTTIVFAVLMLATFFLVYGYVPDVGNYYQWNAQLQTIVKSGYVGGLQLRPSPLALLIFAHCIFTIIRLPLGASGQLSRWSAFRGAISTANIVWFIYFINRPEIAHLAINVFLYGFLLIDSLRTVEIAIRSGDRFGFMAIKINSAILLLSMIVFAITPRIFSLYQEAIPSVQQHYNSLIFRHKAHWTMLSGIRLEPAFAEKLINQSSFLRERGKDRSVVYISNNAFILRRLSERISDIPVDDGFFQLLFIHDLPDLSDKLSKKRVQEVLVDADESSDSHKAQSEFLSAVRKSLSRNYHLARIEEGWQCWMLNPAG